ncbi:MAG: phosphoribosylaminoimidazolesuccinocarboxamide synthase [Chloroflexota bacterium]
MAVAIREFAIDSVPLFRKGKVRDTYDLGDRLLMVASDRLSAFDVILPDGIPDKGRVLTGLSVFWFNKTAHIMPNHLISANVNDLPEVLGPHRDVLDGRFMIVKKAERIDIECVVRGYLAGSAWAEYQKSGTVCGQSMPDGMIESQQLDEPIFTPAMKVDDGHDENISIDRMASIVGKDLTDQLMTASLDLYNFARSYAAERGIILADTKFEFGMVDGQLTLIDEIFTPDSSRFWDASAYEPGTSQESFDKQFVRDWLSEAGWDRNPPAPPLPAEVIEGTASRYREAYRLITGEELPNS